MHIVLLARGMKKRWEPEILSAIHDHRRLLVITPFNTSATRVTRHKAAIRNQLIADLSNEICVGYISPGGQLDTILQRKKYEII